MIGRRIQRFPSRSPNCSSFFGLGWARITTYILVKKLLFAMSILRLDNQNIVQQVFVKKVKLFHENEVLRINENRSPTFDILNCAVKAGVYNILYEITIDDAPVVSKCAWSKLIWSKAW